MIPSKQGPTMMKDIIAFESKERTPTVACMARKSWVASPFISPAGILHPGTIKDIIAEDVKKGTNKHFIYDSQRYSNYNKKRKTGYIYIYDYHDGI